MNDEQIVSSYFQNEAWFVLRESIYRVRTVGVISGRVRGKKIMNSYGKVRYIFEDGLYLDYSKGEEIKQLDQYEHIEE